MCTVICFSLFSGAPPRKAISQLTTQKTTTKAIPCASQSSGSKSYSGEQPQNFGHSHQAPDCPMTCLHNSRCAVALTRQGDTQWCLPPGPSPSSGTASGTPCQSSQAHGRADKACHTSSGHSCSSSRAGRSLGLSHHMWGNSVLLLPCSRKAGKSLPGSSKLPSLGNPWSSVQRWQRSLSFSVWEEKEAKGSSGSLHRVSLSSAFLAFSPSSARLVASNKLCCPGLTTKRQTGEAVRPSPGYLT